ncbi:hypothetical protein TWF106_007785 [Orbilia oligospora]|uniref:DUF202 domain-containing protein n=1 Tax=Orbilia oligospora TaxID=2813651 RepID=A0A6G1M8F2_ORBOL|nr:hypothetical protein TWF788_004504 [Orbilia oligospora]KAF3204847.1 hypothetical protein TWF679_009519 [Orbilia oligospora]KAF3218193.1 hypothetical protein TWF106_007785 [Orbilia oligospora]KAF3221200.1 hypothetical protein TWF191_007169 [Orbilia oligospora]KAF3249884.1 hypothetical protein TWF192_005381 [Orbilia oligospora]
MASILGNYGTFDHRTNYVLVDEIGENCNLFLARPLIGPLVFENTASDARDHCANERNFLSWLRLSSYLAIVSVAIMTTFHFTSEPTELEKRIAFPLGLLFWLLAILSLACGVGNYLKTVKQYSRKVALVQSGWKTQLLGAIVAGTVICCCVLFLVNNALNDHK